MRNKFKLLIRLFCIFMKIGLFTLGGGYAMIPLIQREMVDRYKYIDEKQMVEILAVAGSMPGSIAVNIATFVGYKIAGFRGAVFSTVGNVLPSFAIIYIISFFMRQFSDLEIIKFAFDGIRVGVVALIFKALISVFRQSPKGAVPYVIIAAAFLLVLFDLINAIFIIIAAALTGIAYTALKAVIPAGRMQK